MRKMSNPLLFSFLAADIVFAVGIVKLADFSIYCLLGEVILAVIAAVMGYVLVSRLIIKYEKQESLRQSRLDEYKTELGELKESCQRLALVKNEELDERISRIISVQNDSVKNVEKFCNTMIASIDGSIRNLLGGLEHSLTCMTEDTFGKMDKLIEKQSKEIDHSKAVLTEQLELVNKGIKNQIALSEKRTMDLQKSIRDEIEKQNAVIDSMQRFFENRVQDMCNEHNVLLGNIKEELLLYTDELDESLKIYSGDVSTGLRGIWDEKFGVLSQNCEAYLGNVSKSMVDDLKNCNFDLLKVQTEQDHQKISEIAEKYDDIMEKYISYLKQEVSTGITNFQNVNRKAFEDHAAYTELLIQTEEDFISKLGMNNETLKGLISEGYRECKSASEDVAALLGRTLSGYNEVVVSELAEKLEAYSNELVEKSAEAVANVQKDNNLKLQEMCDSIVLYSGENIKFTQKCAEQNYDTKQRVDDLIDQNRDFLDKLNKVSDGSIKGMGDTLDGYLEKMGATVEKLNFENSNRFNEAMVEYRNTFVSENARALADVQGTTVADIKKAYMLIGSLSDSIQNSNDNNEKCISNMEELISDGSEEMNNTVKEMVKSVGDQFEKYGELLERYEEEKNGVLRIVQENTQNYEKTLKRIVDAQKEMNTLTEKDRELLEKLIRG